MMSFSAVMELATLVAYLVIIIGGRQKREQGWKLLTLLLVIIGVAQCFCMSTVVCIVYYDGGALLMVYRHTFTITIISSRSRVGERIGVILGARSAGFSRYCWPLVSHSRPIYYRQKGVMNLSPVRGRSIEIGKG